MNRSTNVILSLVVLLPIVLSAGNGYRFGLLPFSIDVSPVDNNALPPPPPSHTIVNVSTISELREAMLNLESHTTIMLADGTYRLDELPEKQLLTPYDSFVEDIAIRGASGNRDAVIIEGVGQFSDAAEYGIQIFDSTDVLIADLTIGRVYYHCISVHPERGAARVRLYNLHLFDSGEQPLKSNTDGSSQMEDLVVENCLFELTNGWGVHPELGYAYGNGMSAQAMTNLIVRDCTFRNLYYTTNDLAGPAVLVWRGSTNTLIERNTFIRCARGISLGLSEGGSGHSGGIIRNNFFYRAADIGAPVDVAIYVESPNAEVYHNTIVVSDSYYAPIEVRYSAVNNVIVENNILDGGEIKLRDGASATISNNTFEATSDWFVDMEKGDLHLQDNTATREFAIDKGSVLSEVTSDIDGELRPSGPMADLGADEFNGTYTGTFPDPGTPPEHSSSGSLKDNLLGTLTLAGISIIAIIIMAKKRHLRK